MRRALILTAAVAASAALSAGSAMAQTQPQERPGEAAGLRYLGWSGRTTDTTVPAPQAASADGLRRPAAVIPHAGVGAPPVTRASAAVSAPRTPDRIRREGLTPATAWLAPEADAPAPAPVQPQPAYVPERPAPTQPAPPQPVRSAPPPTRPAPVEQPRVEPPAPAPAPVRTLPEVPAFDPADPMAPRRDAPIFRMQQPAPQPTPQGASAAVEPTQQPVFQSGAASPTQTARYYSVHRPSGRQPDAVTLPEPVTVDVIQLAQTPTSDDLSEPQPGPALMRNAEGRMVPVPGQDEDQP